VSGTQFLQVPCGLGAKNGDMDNICELLVNVVIFDKRKGTGTLEPKGKGYGSDGRFSSYTVCDSPGK